MSQNNKRIVYNKLFALLFAASDVTEWAPHLRWCCVRCCVRVMCQTVYGQNGDRNGYIQKGNNPKQHLCSSIEAYVIDRRLYTYMTYNC